MVNPGKERRDSENYEEYWKITLEYSNINSKKFLTALKIIKEFIDENIDALQEDYSAELYEELQSRVNEFNPKFPTSVRKSINQYVKLGFVHPLEKNIIKIWKIFWRQKLMTQEE